MIEFYHKEKDLLNLICLVNNLEDTYSDFYITLNNQRIFLKDKTNLSIFFKRFVKKGEIILGDQERGILITWGISDKSNRKYIKILYKNIKHIKELLNVFIWNFGYLDWYIKVKKENPVYKIALRKGFKVIGDRGKEILLYRKGVKHGTVIINNKDID